MSGETVRTVVCTGAKDDRDRTICGGGGWWGPTAPTKCPRCGRETILRGTTFVAGLRLDVNS